MNWNAELYDQKHAFVYQYGESVLELLNAQPGERILDLGCGTGFLTDQIQSLGAEVIGIDHSPNMINAARKNFPDLNFSVANASRFNFTEPFDAIFSNAVLHWVKDHGAMMKCVYENLKPGGRFVAEMGGKGNVAMLIAATKKILLKYGYYKQAETQVWRFPGLGEYTHELEKHGFRVTYAVHFDRKTPLQDSEQGVAKWITMFGSQYFEGIPQGEMNALLAEITEILRPYFCEDGLWFADYKRLRFIAVKEM